MAIHDIIRRNEDRLFIVDTECFIIFTGDSINDRKPFIRIGNWLDLPAEIIPLVENIIITDSLAGNPAHEQFNIDIKYLPTNRYIGSSHVVKRFLEFQSYFGLDLHNASIIDADRDIPDISKKSAVSDNDDFIGVFYRNGNFKVTHRGSDLFDLHEYHDSPSSDKGVHERLAALSKPRRYAGSGFAVIEHNPVFYRANSFTSYLFPHTYFPSFFALGINPRSISSVIHPTENYLGISRYLKWRNASGGKVTIFTDHDENPSMLLNLFPGVKIVLAPFTGMRAETSPGMSFSQVSHSFNVIGELVTAGSGKMLRFAYMKGISELKKISKEKLDLVLMNYSVFEDSSYLSKSFRAPILLVDDGNPSVRKVPALENPVIRNDIQYEVDCCDTQEIPLRAVEYLPSDISGKIVEESFLESLVPAPGADLTPEESARFFNTLSYLRHVYLNTQDRKLSSLAKKILREGYAHHARETVYSHGELFRIDLLVTNGTVYEFARPLADPPPDDRYLLDHAHLHRAIELSDLSDSAERELYRRITEDRNRLTALLGLFLANPEYRREVAALKKAIEERKALFSREHSRHMHHKPGKSSGFISTLRASIGADSASGPFPSSETGARSHAVTEGIADRMLRAIGLSAGSTTHSSSGLPGGVSDDSSSIARGGASTAVKPNSLIRVLSSVVRTITRSDRSSDGASAVIHGTLETGSDASAKRMSQSSTDTGSGRKGTAGRHRQYSDKVSLSSIPARSASLIRGIRTSRGARRALMIIIVLIITAIAVIAGRQIRGYYLQYKEEQTRTARMKAEQAERRRLTAEYNIEVREYDVYLYANETAVKNGYKPISLSDYNKRWNPNWIYPGNVFVMLDGSRVTVIEGDTLWNLAREKIIAKHLAFFRVYDKARAEHASGRNVGKDIIEKLRGLAFNDPQKKLVKELEQQQLK